MNAVIANALFSLYGDGFLETFFDTMDNVFSATLQVLQSDFMTSAFAIFSGISASLIILFFYIDFMDHLSREMISFEVLVSMLIKLMVCIVVCVEIPQLCTWVVQLSDAFFRFTGGFFSSEANANGTDIVLLLPDTEDKFLDAMNNVFWGGSTYSAGNGMHKFATAMRQIRFALEHPLWTIESFIIVLLAGILKLVGYFIAISTALVLIARMFFAPIGMINIYRGEYSSGISYFKSLLATACSFGVMVAIVGAASLLTQSLISGHVFEALGLESDGSTETVSVQSSDDGSVLYVGEDTGKTYDKNDLTEDEEGSYTGVTDYLVVINFSDDGVDNFVEMVENALNNLNYYVGDDVYLPDEVYEDVYHFESDVDPDEASSLTLQDSSSGGYPSYAEISDIESIAAGINSLSDSDSQYSKINDFWESYFEYVSDYDSKANYNYLSDVQAEKDTAIAGARINTLQEIYDKLTEFMGNSLIYEKEKDSFESEFSCSMKEVKDLAEKGINAGSTSEKRSKKQTSLYSYTDDELILLSRVSSYLGLDKCLLYNDDITDAIQCYCSALLSVADQISDTNGENILTDSNALSDSENVQMELESEYAEKINLALNFRTVFAALIPQVAAIVGMAGATRYIREAIG